MRAKILLVIMLLTTVCAVAQEDLSRLNTYGASRNNKYRDIKNECIGTWMFQVTYAHHWPGADTKVLYNHNNSVGGGVYYKTGKNWLFGFNGNFISGNSVKISREDLFGEILDVNGEIITGDGIYGSYALFERGAHFQLCAGKVFAFKKPNPNSGIFIKGGLGYLFNRLRTEFGSYASPPPALNGDYLYGYDRKRGGFAYSGEIGYLFLSSTRVLNFSVSFEFTQAHTAPQRDWDFHLMQGDNGKYLDRYYGIRFAIYIPTYKRAPADYYYY
ncbi:MAG: hypothetical protein MJ000_01830 [Bacteroidales bacterium]|nr:hypothetical protein [Bacteroidales bacterium]